MSALPIFDEILREFVPAPAPRPAAAAPARPRAPRSAPPPSVRLIPAVERDERLSHFQSCLTRLKQTLEEAGNAADAVTIGELVAFLHSPQAAKALADERDHRPIYAVAAAYIDALAAVSDESAAAQTLARKLIALGYNLARGLTPGDMRETYQRALKFARTHPAGVDVKAALDHALAAENGGDLTRHI
jgi:hypothetical protein